MAYSTSNPPQLMSQLIAGSRKKWSLTGTDGASLVAGSSYISNGVALGMAVGDELTYFNSSALTLHDFVVQSVNTESVNLSAGTTASS